MAKQPEIERRIGNAAILAAIEELKISNAEIKKDTHQIFNRLDKINGCVQDYVENRHKWQDIFDDMFILTSRVKVNEDQHRLCEDKFIGKKLFITVSILLGLVISIFTILNFIQI